MIIWLSILRFFINYISPDFYKKCIWLKKMLTKSFKYMKILRINLLWMNGMILYRFFIITAMLGAVNCLESPSLKSVLEVSV